MNIFRVLIESLKVDANHDDHCEPIGRTPHACACGFVQAIKEIGRGE